MEYLDGETLKDVILREGPLPERRAIDITLQLLAALRFAHRREVDPPRRQAAQRDGAARRPREGGRLRHRARRRLRDDRGRLDRRHRPVPVARAGARPARRAASPTSTRSASCSTRCSPAGCRSRATRAVAIAMKHVQETPVPPRQIVPVDPAPSWRPSCMRAMAKDPARRYHSADEMGMDLDRVRKGLGVTQARRPRWRRPRTPPPAARWSRRRPRRRRVPGRRRRRRRRAGRGRGWSC